MTYFSGFWKETVPETSLAKATEGCSETDRSIKILTTQIMKNTFNFENLFIPSTKNVNLFQESPLQ